ncbi:L-Aspartase-like protein [Pyronema omphalodes]|nr:L-Aspartase-like protein [Pyronema omphalodes]
MSFVSTSHGNGYHAAAHSKRDAVVNQLTPESSPAHLSPCDRPDSTSRRSSPAPRLANKSGVFTLLTSNHVIDPTTTVVLTGQDLTISELQTIMKNGSRVQISSVARSAVQASVDALHAHLKADHCIYGVNTGFGASADSRTNKPDVLQAALLQMQHIGILPSLTAGNKNILKEEWVRGAMAIRINSLLRGHSGVRWEVLERLVGLLNNNAIPIVPLRGSISASGDLSPLSYIAGAVTGHPGIHCLIGPERKTVSSKEALASCDLQPVEFRAKEVLGLINGTSVSCAAATNVISETSFLAQMSQVLTAMAVEVSTGSAEPFDPWVATLTRPHPGQKEVAANIWYLLTDSTLARDRHPSEGEAEHVGLRQDRYPLRTAPQWIGPLLEDLDLAISQLGIECNSTTDNPLIDTSGSGFARIMHAGNFQAMHVTSSMEKTRSALQAIGKIIFQQLTEIVNYCTAPLPPNLASDTEPSLSYTMKAVDIAAAAYCSELGILAAGNVGSHVQCAEDRNQAVNSLALLSARQADEMTDVLTMLMSNYIYVLCQAVDLRVMTTTFLTALEALVSAETQCYFKGMVNKRELTNLCNKVFAHVKSRFEATMRDDAKLRFSDIFSTATSIIFDELSGDNIRPNTDMQQLLDCVRLWKMGLVHKALALYTNHRNEFVVQESPALETLGRTKALYQFVRRDLGVGIHKGRDELPTAETIEMDTTGAQITKIYQAMKDGRMEIVLVRMFADME